MPSKIQVDQIAGATGNTVTLPSGQTLDLSSGTVTLPSAGITADKLNLISTASVPSVTAKGTPSVSDGYIQLNCEQNSHGIKIKSPPHSAGANYTMVMPNSLGTASQVLRMNSGATALEFATAPSGKLLQVVSATKTATQTITGAGQNDPEEWNSIGLSASITPASASNKILILVNVVGGADNNAFMSIFRGTSATSIGNTISNTNLAVPDSPSNRQPSFSGDFYNAGISSLAITQPAIFLDSPSTTSARVYEVGVSIHSTATVHINRSVSDVNYGYQIRGVSTITLMEIGA